MKHITRFFGAAIIALTIFSCTPKKPEAKDESANQTQSKISNYKLEEVWATSPSLKTPESVIYDDVRNVLYVSNVNENPWEKDGNGFISKVSTTGEILDLEWVTGMNGPKGMAIVGNTLYVNDIDELISIDIEKGEIITKVKIEGASGLNDITNGENGKIYTSDSNEGKIYQYENGTATVFNSDAPGRPNGLLLDNGNLLVAFSEASEFVSFDIQTMEKKVIATEIGAGDGIASTNEPGTFLITDWNGELFVINQNGEKQSLLNTKDRSKNTADIWFIKDQNLVLVPTFFDNRVVAYRLTN